MADLLADLGLLRFFALLSMENKMDSFSFLFLYEVVVRGRRKRREEKDEVAEERYIRRSQKLYTTQNSIAT